MENALSIIVLIAVGAISGLLYVKVFKKKMIGNVWGALIIGVVGGSLIGFFIIKFERWIPVVTDNKITVGFSAALVGAFFLLWVFSKISPE